MQRPELIIFDYGNTLVCEPDWNPKKGNAALLEITENPKDIQLSDIVDYGSKYLIPKIKALRDQNTEVSGSAYSRVLFAHFGLTLPVSDLDIEKTFWYAASKGAAMPYAHELLEFLKEEKIKTGIISNMMWSGEALKTRLDRILPENEFDFVFTSSDFIFRKPEPAMFEAAIALSGTDKEHIWFCGDNPKADIEGASRAGMYPVYYKNKADSRGYSCNDEPNCAYCEISNLSELIDLIKMCD